VRSIFPVGCTGKILLTAHKKTDFKAPFVQLWDLTRGTSAAMLPLALNVQSVCWSGSGSHYALLPEDGLNIQVLEGSTSAVVSHTRTQKDRITAIAFTDETLLMGDVNGQVIAVTAGEEPVVLREASGPGRVKAITVSSAGITAIAFTNGLVEVYRGDREEVQTYNTNVRLTSIAIGAPKTGPESICGPRKPRKPIEAETETVKKVSLKSDALRGEQASIKQVRKKSKKKKNKGEYKESILVTEKKVDKNKRAKEQQPIDAVNTADGGEN
jgi:hypothetical protein